ncbi:Tuberous sclerosis 2-like protein [Ascosphaera aggregata]|nr:Tuberous sclerosis 2-like protein [Ascosphaera aggregata]
MSPRDASSSLLYYKHPASAITDVLKSLTSGRPKLPSRLSHDSAGRQSSFNSIDQVSSSPSTPPPQGQLPLRSQHHHQLQSPLPPPLTSSASHFCQSQSYLQYRTHPSHTRPYLQPQPQTHTQTHTYAQGTMEGRGPRVAFGFESLHRASQALATSTEDDIHAHPPDFDTLLRGLQKDTCASINGAIESAELAARWVTRCWNSEQCLSLWAAGSWLLREPGPSHEAIEGRKASASLLKGVADRQDLSLTTRQKIVGSISIDMPHEALPELVNPLIALTDYGRKVDFPDEPLLPLITRWIFPIYEIIASFRSRMRRGQKPTYPVDEDSLGNLFQLVIDVVTLQREAPPEEDIEGVLEQVFIVCRKTSVATDIKNALSIFDAIISISRVPHGIFATLLEVLCSIQASVKQLAGPTSRTVRSLAKTEKQAHMVDTLHMFIQATGESEHGIHVIRGAVNIFSDLLATYAQDRMPDIDFLTLITTLEAASEKSEGRIDADILEACLDVLKGKYVEVVLQHNDLSKFVSVIISCTHKPVEPPVSPATLEPSPSSSTLTRSFHSDEARYNISALMSRIIETLESLWPRFSEEQKGEICNLFMASHSYLNDSQSQLAQEYYREKRLCYPENPEWTMHCKGLINNFIVAKDKLPEVRIQAVETLSEVYKTGTAADVFDDEETVRQLVQTLAEEQSYAFVEKFVAFLVDLSANCADDNFHQLITALSQIMAGEEKADAALLSVPSEPSSAKTSLSTQTSPRTPISADRLENSMSNLATIGLVRIFLRTLVQSAARTAVVFEKLIDIALCSKRPVDARLTALKLLFRIRCDSSGALYVISATENDFLVNVLTRTNDRASDIVSRINSVDDLKASFSSDDASNSQGGKQALKDGTPYPLSTINSRSTSQHRKWTPPIWTYIEPTGLPEEPPECVSMFAVAFADEQAQPDADSNGTPPVVFKINLWLEAIIKLLQREKDWGVYSYVLAHLGPQLMNRHLLQNSAIPQIKLLRSVLCEQIKNETFLEPFVGTGVKKADVAVCIYDALTMLVCFKHHFAKSEQDDIVRCFMLGIGSWEGTSRGCIHALSLCCHEIPRSVTRCLIAILDKMAKIITQHHITVHILEFLALLARLPEVFVHLREAEIRPVFGICIRFIQASREKSIKAFAVKDTSVASASISEDLSKYVYSLTYHVMIFWFLSLKLQDRVNHVSWITRSLIFRDEHGKDVVEEQSQVLIDMMQRATFSDLGETIPFEKFPPNESDGPVTRKSWIIGMSIVTVEVAGASGLSQITKRQASGTTYAMYQQRTAPTLPHQIPTTYDSHLVAENNNNTLAILPGHVLLQLTTTAMPTPMIMQPIPLPDDDATNRALRTFDRNDIVDGHKIGVVYVGEGQTTETEILANTHGSADYEYFLQGLGTKVTLKDAKFNTQGLHSDIDGEYTYAWRDRTTEIIYHIATMMPTNLETDPQCINKKRHIGNDFVNIIYNRSNQSYNFHTIASQFNFVNIVICPVSRISAADRAHENDSSLPENFDEWFFIVKVMTKAGFPDLSAAAVPKVVSARKLPAFVRLIALNATFYSSVSSSPGGEHISSWRNRLREIERLRHRASTQAAESDKPCESTYPSTSFRRSGGAKAADDISPQQPPKLNLDVTEEWTPQTDTTILTGLDFSRWSR